MTDIYIIGGGNVSADDIASIPKDAHVAVCNGGYLKHPKANYMFYQDESFAESIKREDFRKFAGRVLSIFPSDNPRVELITKDDITVGKGKKKFTALGKNTGFHAICWALNNGYEHVYLLGFDCRYTWGSMTMPEVFELWQKQHAELAALGLPITNLTQGSGIDNLNTMNGV